MGNMYNSISTATHLQQQFHVAGQIAKNDVRKRCTNSTLQPSLFQTNHTALPNQNQMHMQMSFTTKTAKPTIGLNKWLICLAMLTLAIVLPFSKALAQPSLYSFAGSTTTYASITGTDLGAAINGDDVAVGSIPIGFTFNYNGIGQTIVAIASNGFIELGSSLTYTSNATSLWTPSTNLLAGRANIIAPLWDDNHSLGTVVTYSTTGTVGSRIFTVQYTALHIGGGGTSTNPTINMQIKLFEGTNAIQFVYGATSAALSGTTASIGLSGNVGNFLSVTPLSPANTSTVRDRKSVV